MNLLRSVGNLVQKLLFTTTFDDLVAGIDDVKRRIDALERKIEEKTGELERKLAELGNRADDQEQSKAS